MNPSSLLLIEDNPANGGIVGAALRRLDGDRVHVSVMSLADASRHLASCPPADLPRLILVAPGDSPNRGIEIAGAIRAIERAALLPVVLMGCPKGEDTIRDAAAHRVNSCVRATDEPERLARDLDQLTRYWLDLNIPPPTTAGTVPA